ncbi:MAG TPA: hypothetical protein VG777_06390 [Thermoanaerobaculia bacterium]|nr:hypothetical protein [Thermoanaerobaculia bacterium]
MFLSLIAAVAVPAFPAAAAPMACCRGGAAMACCLPAAGCAMKSCPAPRAADAIVSGLPPAVLEPPAGAPALLLSAASPAPGNAAPLAAAISPPDLPPRA